MRLILVLLLWLVCSIAQADKREDLRQAIFGQPTNPATMPAVEVVASTPLNVTAATKRKLTITTAGLQNYCYDLQPANNDGTKLAIVWQGHTNTLAEIGVADTAQALVDRGVRVIVGGMPGKSGNQGSSDHNTYTSLRPFIEPVTACLNYASAQDPDTQAVMMTGISGGGWTTTVASAIDTRIDLSIPIAGSLPNHMRSANSLGDYEQTEVSKTLGYAGLYALGAAGPGRKQLQILNPNDSCCFARAGQSGSYGSNYQSTIADPVNAVASVAGGSFAWTEDTTIPGQHKISQWAINRIVTEFLGEQTPPTPEPGPAMATITTQTRKAKLTLDSSQLAANVTDGVVVITKSHLNQAPLNAEPLDSDSSYPAQANGGDLRFSSDEAGSTVLDYYLHKWTQDTNPANGECEIYVKVPTQSASADTEIWMWWEPGGSIVSESSTSAFPSSLITLLPLDEDPSGGAPQMLDLTSNNVDFTSAGSMTSGDSVAAKVGNGLDFDGADDDINVATPTVISDAQKGNNSIAAWIYPHTVSGDPVYPVIWSNVLFGGSYGGSYALLRTVGADTLMLQAGSSHASGDGALSKSQNNVVALNTWQHVVFVYDSSTKKWSIYKDGTALTLSTQTGASNVPPTVTRTLYVGNDKLAGATRDFDGLLDDFRWYSKALSASEIKAIWLNTKDAAYITPSASEAVSGGSAVLTNGGRVNVALVNGGLVQ